MKIMMKMIDMITLEFVAGLSFVMRIFDDLFLFYPLERDVIV